MPISKPTTTTPKAKLTRSTDHEADCVLLTLSSDSYDVVPPTAHNAPLNNDGARFVAGTSFFNYEGFGALREGLPEVDLFRRSHIGLLIAGLCGGFSAVFMQNVFIPILTQQFKWTDANQTATTAARYLMIFPGSLTVFVGMVSDKFPIAGYRRKPYMILGSLLAAVMFLAIAVLFYLSMDFNVPCHAILTTVASAGIQINVIPCLALTVEYAQREHLYQRGQLQSTVFAWFYGAQALGALTLPWILTYSPIGNTLLSSRINLGQIAMIEAATCLVPIPFMLLCLDEDRVVYASRGSFREGFRELWVMLKQNVFAGILIGLCGIVFFIGTFSPTIEIAKMAWSGLDSTSYPWVVVTRLVPQFGAIVIWRFFLVSEDWRVLGGVGGGVYIVSQLAVTVLACFDIVRSKVFYYICTAVGQIVQGWLAILVPIMATEVTNAGQEGAVVGLIQSFVILFVIGSSSFWTRVDNLVHDPVSPFLIIMDENSTRLHIFFDAMVYAAIGLVGLTTVSFLPTQKLDAQQRRVFGGYNNLARIGLIIVFVAVFAYDLVNNLVKLQSKI